MNLLYLLLGIVLLAAGRRLYWLFVAAVGFGVGLVLAREYFAPEGLAGATDGNEWGMLIAVVGGILGAILAILFQKLAVALAGAAAGALGGVLLFEMFGAESVAWIGLIIGAILGGILVLKIFDWGLIIFSSLAGASFVLDGMQLKGGEGALLFLAAFVVGVVVQGMQLRSARATPEKPESPRSVS